MERRRRLGSWWWDYLVVLAWLLVVLLLVGVPSWLGWLDLAGIWSRPAAADAAVLVLTVLPYLAYLVATEAGPARATWGKRRSGLEVTSARGAATGGQILLRNVVKVLPWQLGHMAAMRFAADVQLPLAIACYAAAVLGLGLVAGPALLGRRGLHDRVAGTRVGTGRLTAPDRRARRQRGSSAAQVVR